MNLEERDRRCNEELDAIIRMAETIKDSANEGASQKSGGIRLIAEDIIKFLKEIDCVDDLRLIKRHVNDVLEKN